MLFRNCLLLILSTLLAGLALSSHLFNTEDDVNNSDVLTVFFEDDGATLSDSFDASNPEGDTNIFFFNCHFPPYQSKSIFLSCRLRYSVNLDSNISDSIFLIKFQNLAPPNSI